MTDRRINPRSTDLGNRGSGSDSESQRIGETRLNELPEKKSGLVRKTKPLRLVCRDSVWQVRSGRGGAWRESSGPKFKFFPTKTVPAKKSFVFGLAMLGNLLILAHLGKELNTLSRICTFWWDGTPPPGKFSTFPHQPRPARNKYLTFLAGILHSNKHHQTAYA